MREFILAVLLFIASVFFVICFILAGTTEVERKPVKQAKQSKAKMCNGRRHVPLCPACANEK